MKNSIKTITVSLAAFTTALSATGEPPAWLISDADSQMILFPTVHALSESIDWQSEKLTEVIAATEEIWMEIEASDTPELQAELQKLVAAYGVSPDLSLSDRLTAEQSAQLTDAANALGMPMAQLEPLKPWLAALMLTQVDLARAGITPERGVETVINGLLGERPVRTLESAAMQTRMFAELDDETQIAFLMSSVESVGESAERLGAISEDWAEGDLTGMRALLIDEMQVEYPGLYDIVFKQRNANWAKVLTKELKGSGTDFVAVGAGHLIGDDSVQNMLAAGGYSVKQISLSDYSARIVGAE